MARLLGGRPSAWAPVSQRKSMSRAVNVPSFVTPVLTVTVAGVEPAAAVNSSARVITIFTGLRLRMDSATATGSSRGSILPPKPPPTLVLITRMRLSGMANSPASRVRSWNTSWLQVHTVTALPRAAASVAWGSM